MKTLLMVISLFLSAQSFADPQPGAGAWKHCYLNSDNQGFIMTFARTLKECRRKAIVEALYECRMGAETVHIKGQFSKVQPRYFNLDMECGPIELRPRKKGREI